MKSICDSPKYSGLTQLPTINALKNSMQNGQVVLRLAYYYG